MIRPVVRGLLALALLSSIVLPTREAEACGPELVGPAYVNRHNPDLPLRRFARGHLGVIGPWETSFQVVAWRALVDAPLADDELDALVALERALHTATAPLDVDPATPVPTSGATASGEYMPEDAPWREARATAVGSRGPDIPNGWSTDGAWTPNCLEDAFRAAAAALLDRVSHHGARSDAVRAWVDAQDAVFSNCGATPGRTPRALQDAAPVEQRRDRAYQIAAAHFYAGRYDQAERAFAAVAADAASPWSPIARYLVVRSITRAAQRGRATPDPARLARATQQARALLADPESAAVHDMTRRYEGWIDALRDPGGRLHALGAGLARPGRGAAFAADLHDYVRLSDAAATAAARRAPDAADPLTTWIALRDTPGARDAALALYARTPARPWLLAALASGGDPRDRRLDPLLAAALAVQRGDPGFATARYERLQVLVARGGRAYDEVVRTSHELTDEDGPTARNLYRELALQASTDLDQFVSVAHGRPAGWTDGVGLVLPARAPGADGVLPADFSPVAAQVLSLRVPVRVLLRVAASPTLPLPLRERVTRAALHRAALLDDEGAFLGAAALVPRMSEAAQRPLRALAQSTTRASRRLALLRSLLTGSGEAAVGTAMLDEVPPLGDPWTARCGEAVGAVTPAWFLTAAERAMFARERARWLSLGGGSAWLAAESARVAALSPTAPGMPALLAAAVQNTRNNGCDPRAPVHRASRAAFQALHRLHPRSPEALATRYWY